MTWKVKLLSLSQADITEAAAWYDEQQGGLGDRFFNALTDSLNLLREYSIPRCFKFDSKTSVKRPSKSFLS